MYSIHSNALEKDLCQLLKFTLFSILNWDCTCFEKISPSKNKKYKNIKKTHQKANVAADNDITLYTKGPAIESASLWTGASCPCASSTYDRGHTCKDLNASEKHNFTLSHKQ